MQNEPDTLTQLFKMFIYIMMGIGIANILIAVISLLTEMDEEDDRD